MFDLLQHLQNSHLSLNMFVLLQHVPNIVIEHVLFVTASTEHRVQDTGVPSLERGNGVDSMELKSTERRTRPLKCHRPH